MTQRPPWEPRLSLELQQEPRPRKNKAGTSPRERMFSDLRLLGPRHLTVAILHYLAEHVYEARFGNGSRLNDATDFKAWLEELAAEAER